MVIIFLISLYFWSNKCSYDEHVKEIEHLQSHYNICNKSKCFHMTVIKIYHSIMLICIVHCVPDSVNCQVHL